MGGSAGGDEGGQEGSGYEQSNAGGDGSGIDCAGLIEQTLHPAGGGERQSESGEDAKGDGEGGLAGNEGHEGGFIAAEGDADAEFLLTQGDGIGEDAVDSEESEQQSGGAEA